MFWLELALVLVCIYLGARLGGAALGTMAGLGLAVMVFVLRRTPGELPVDVLLIIVAVVTAASALQAAGGLDYMVGIADRILRARPQAITFLAPVVTWTFTLFAGTGHVAYALLPVIAEVSRSAGVRPERPLSISVIASQLAITASPISAATAGMIALFAANQLDLGLAEILLICIPATLVGALVGALAVFAVGKPLKDDPVYQRRLAEGLVGAAHEVPVLSAEQRRPAVLSVAIFGAAALVVVGMGLFEAARPATGYAATAAITSVRIVEGDPYAFTVSEPGGAVRWDPVDGKLTGKRGVVSIQGLEPGTSVVELRSEADSDRLLTGDTTGLAERIAAGELPLEAATPTRVGMPVTIEIVMIAAAGLMMLLCRASPERIVQGSVMRAGIVAVIAILGIAWLGSTFFSNHSALVIDTLSQTVQRMPWLFSLALFALSVLLYSQAATVAALMQVGIDLGIDPKFLIAMFPAVNGYFLLPTYGTVVAAIQFDQTGTTRIGRWVLNHSFMLPGLVATSVSIATAFALAAVLL